MVNARTTENHPCEILGDLSYLWSTRKCLAGVHVVFVGAATNLCHSWCEAAAVIPLKVTQVCPPGYEVDPAWWASLSPTPEGQFQATEDLHGAIACADVVYTDCWPPRSNDQEHRRVSELFSPLRVTAALLDGAPTDAVFLPCPPVTRGEEVSADAMDWHRCKVKETKHWLLEAQAALLEDVLL